MNKLLIAGLVFGVLFIISVQPWKTSKKTVVEIKDRKIEVELADTPAKRSKGLMYRNELGENNGMLFIFPTISKHSFWMANTYIPLDMIWIDENKKIVHIEQNVPPCTETGKLETLCNHYSSETAAKYVLEVNAGYTQSNDIKVGDSVTF